MVKRKNIFTAADAEGNPVDLIGYTIAWTGMKREYNMMDVISAFKNNNLPVKHLEKGKERISFVLRALNKAKQDTLLREVEKTDTTIRYQFTKEYVDTMPDGTLYKAFRPEEFVVYDKVNDRLLAETPEKEKFLHELLRHCSETFTNSDVTRYIQALFNEASMIPLRGRGSMYFVPAKYTTLVHSVKSMFETIDPDGWFTLIEMPDLKFTKESVKSSFENEMASKLSDLKTEMEKLKSKEDGITPRIYRARMEEIGKWAKDLEMYTELTQYTLEDAKDIIKEASTMLTTFMEKGELPGDVPSETPTEEVA